MITIAKKKYTKGISISPKIQKLHLELQPFKSVSKLLHFHSDHLYQYLTNGDTFPIHIEINLTNVCNQRCPWCINENVKANGRKPEYLNIKRLSMFLANFQSLGGKTITWSGGGEPTCHPEFTEAVEECAKFGLEQALITNGAFDENLVPVISNHMRWIRVSLDAINPEEYKRNKGTEIDVVIDRIIKLVSTRNSRVTPIVGINVNMGEWNFFDIKNIVLKSEELGVNYVQFRPILGRPYVDAIYGEQLTPNFIKTVLPELQLLSQKEKSCKVIVSKDKFKDLLEPNYGRNYGSCRYHRFFCVLNANGDLSVCMFHLYDKRFVFGNIYNETFEAIWKGEQRKRVVKFCEDGGLNLATCQVCCKGHEINKFLTYLDSEDGKLLKEVVLQAEEIKNNSHSNFL
ncbi:MAG: hypothetical protein C0415_00775 [Thermodesulfovibrio sp.]|nr:hypothetical protein [Thermodesulfovibrio sp.]